MNGLFEGYVTTCATEEVIYLKIDGRVTAYCGLGRLENES
jgi:hypothetical protein